MENIDLVFPYVDCNDPVWQKSYTEYRRLLNLPTTINNVRYRQWDNLKYLFRGIEKCLPFIRKVHMIVSNIEQVPSWIDQTKVNIVLHEDIIPKKFLPTFNSTTIEMFLGNIPDLADAFIYGNDDTFLLRPVSDEKFFVDNKVKLITKIDSGSDTMFKKVERNCIRAVKEYLEELKAKEEGANDSSEDGNSEDGSEDTPHAKPVITVSDNSEDGDDDTFLKIGHTLMPKLKSSIIELSEGLEDEIKNACTPFRNEKNFNQYLWSYFDYYSGNSIPSDLSYKYFNFKNNEYAVDKALLIADAIRAGKVDTICINDCKGFRSIAEFEAVKKIINNAFDYIFPIPSKYELSEINIIEKEFRIIQVLESLVVKIDYDSVAEKINIVKELLPVLRKLKGYDDSDDSEES